ncbi:MAG: WD40/YVTN/BNR-like repeat-containing protein, partial [Saprospiraceae bacterium]
TWASLNSLTAFVTSIYFKDANTGWVYIIDGRIYKTTDGGSTWTLLTTLTGGLFNNFSFGDANTCFGALSSNSLMKSTDGGDNWSTLAIGGSIAFYDTYATDANNCWAVGYNGAIYNTIDGGTTWTQQTSNTTNILLGVHFVDANTGWAVGVFGTILKTTTGGLLPVELTYFKGENVNQANHLSWQTASEQNNEGFEIERSTNGTDWETIGFVQGNGTTLEVSDYEFIDDLNRVGRYLKKIKKTSYIY